MTLSDFIAKYNGKIVDTDLAYGGQCMDLMHQYIVDVLGLPLSLFAAPTAYEAYKGANDSRFTKTDNTPTGVPQAGDIMFWNTTVGSAGHVAIFVSGDANSFTSFDQNWPTGSLCHEQPHDYKGVAGWLHFNQNDLQNTIDELRQARDNNWTLYQNELEKNNELNQQLTDELTKNQGLREANDQLTKTDADTGAQLLEAQHKNNDYDQVLKVLNATDLTSALSAIDQLKSASDDISKHAEKVLLPIADNVVKPAKPQPSLWTRIINTLKTLLGM